MTTTTTRKCSPCLRRGSAPRDAPASATLAPGSCPVSRQARAGSECLPISKIELALEAFPELKNCTSQPFAENSPRWLVLLLFDATGELDVKLGGLGGGGLQGR